MLQLLIGVGEKSFAGRSQAHAYRREGVSLLFLIRGLRLKEGTHQSVIFRFVLGGSTWVGQPADLARLSEVVFMKKLLESDNPVNAICPEDAELALVIAAKIDQTTTTPASAGQRHLVDRTDALPVLVFEQHDRLTRHRC